MAKEISSLEKVESAQVASDGIEVSQKPESGMEIKANQMEMARVITEAPSDNALNDATNIIAITNAQQRQKEEEKEIEKILEKDMADIYLSLSPEKQEEFRMRGEEAAKNINILLHKAKIQVGKIIEVIKKWLSVIPGLNKFFLEQEAKIRADEILRLNKK